MIMKTVRDHNFNSHNNSEQCQDVSSQKKKRSKQHDENANHQSSQVLEVTNHLNLHNLAPYQNVSSPTKKKKKRKHNHGNANQQPSQLMETSSEHNFYSENNCVHNEDAPSPTKKKKKAEQPLQLMEANTDQTLQNFSENQETVRPKKKKKKGKRRHDVSDRIGHEDSVQVMEVILRNRLLSLDNIVVNGNKSSPKKKKKKKQKVHRNSSEEKQTQEALQSSLQLSTVSVQDDSVDVLNQKESPSKKKKKKKHKRKLKISEENQERLHLKSNFQTADSTDIVHVVVDNSTSKKRKKDKSKHTISETDEGGLISTNHCQKLNFEEIMAVNTSSIKKKKKHTKKHKTVDANQEMLQLNCQEVNSVSNTSTCEKKKKHKRKRYDYELTQETLQLSNMALHCLNNELTLKKKKKHKTQYFSTNSLQESQHLACENMTLQGSCNEPPSKKKKKKDQIDKPSKEVTCNISMQIFVNRDTNSNGELSSGQASHKKKKKKHKNKEKQNKLSTESLADSENTVLTNLGKRKHSDSQFNKSSCQNLFDAGVQVDVDKCERSSGGQGHRKTKKKKKHKDVWNIDNETNIDTDNTQENMGNPKKAKKKKRHKKHRMKEPKGTHDRISPPDVSDVTKETEDTSSKHESQVKVKKEREEQNTEHVKTEAVEFEKDDATDVSDHSLETLKWKKKRHREEPSIQTSAETVGFVELQNKKKPNDVNKDEDNTGEEQNLYLLEISKFDLSPMRDGKKKLQAVSDSDSPDVDVMSATFEGNAEKKKRKAGQDSVKDFPPFHQQSVDTQRSVNGQVDPKSKENLFPECTGSDQSINGDESLRIKTPRKLRERKNEKEASRNKHIKELQVDNALERTEDPKSKENLDPESVGPSQSVIKDEDLVVETPRKLRGRKNSNATPRNENKNEPEDAVALERTEDPKSKENLDPESVGPSQSVIKDEDLVVETPRKLRGRKNSNATPRNENKNEPEDAVALERTEGRKHSKADKRKSNDAEDNPSSSELPVVHSTQPDVQDRSSEVQGHSKVTQSTTRSSSAKNKPGTKADLNSKQSSKGGVSAEDLVAEVTETPNDKVVVSQSDLFVPPHIDAIIHSLNKVERQATLVELEKHLKGLGIHLRLGRWLKQENDKLKANWDKILKHHPRAEPYAILNKRSGTLPEQKEMTKYITNCSFFQALASGLNRSICSCYARARRMFNPGANKGKYTDEDYQQVQRLLKIYGYNWALIGKKMGRTGTSLNDMYQWRSQNHKTGAWDSEEEAKLVKAIQDVMGVTDLSNLYHQIPWKQVAEKLKTRPARLCRDHWVRRLAWKVNNKESRKEWTMEDNTRLLKLILNLSVVEERCIDWDLFITEFDNAVSPQYLSQRWFKIKARLPNYKNLTFKEVCDRLKKKYKSNLEAMQDSEES